MHTHTHTGASPVKTTFCSYSCDNQENMHSVLIMRDACAQARPLLSPGVCLSVRLSRWWIVSRWLKVSSNFFLGPAAPSLHCALAAPQCIVIGPVCGFVDLCVCVCLWICYHDNSKLCASILTKHRYPIPRGTLQRAHEIHGVGNICDFRLKSPLISETVRDRP